MGLLTLSTELRGQPVSPRCAGCSLGVHKKIRCSAYKMRLELEESHSLGVPVSNILASLLVKLKNKAENICDQVGGQMRFNPLVKREDTDGTHKNDYQYLFMWKSLCPFVIVFISCHQMLTLLSRQETSMNWNEEPSVKVFIKQDISFKEQVIFPPAYTRKWKETEKSPMASNESST